MVHDGGFGHGQAYGKAILVGEHAVVYGVTALAFPLKTLRLRVSLRFACLSNEKPFPRESPFLREPMEALLQEMFTLVERAQPPKPWEWHFESSIPVGAGLGSSAALSVALLRATVEEISRDQLAFFANQLEKRFHGNPSGLDAAVVALEQPLQFRRGPPPTWQVLALHGPWPFVLVDTQERASTAAMVARAAPAFLGAEGERRLCEFQEVTDQTLHGLQNGNAIEVADAMNRSSRLLDEIGVITPSMRQIMTFLRHVYPRAGVKPTGAGGGGCLLVLIPEESEVTWAQQLRGLFASHHHRPIGEIYDVHL